MVLSEGPMHIPFVYLAAGHYYNSYYCLRQRNRLKTDLWQCLPLIRELKDNSARLTDSAEEVIK